MASQDFGPLTGSGHAAFTGAPRVVTDIAVGVNAVPPLVGRGLVGDSDQLRHAGLFGLYYLGVSSNLGTYITPTPTITPAWWTYIEFVTHDPFIFNPSGFTFDGVFWNLAAGVTIHLEASW